MTLTAVGSLVDHFLILLRRDLANVVQESLSAVPFEIYQELDGNH